VNERNIIAAILTAGLLPKPQVGATLDPYTDHAIKQYHAVLAALARSNPPTPQSKP
jgi:hypothetical protein